jgi:hypothetical protein
VPASLKIASSLGKMPTTSVRRLTSPLSRLRPLVAAQDRVGASSPPSISSISSRPKAEPDARDASPIISPGLDFVILNELGYLPFAQAGGQLLFQNLTPASFPGGHRSPMDN